MTLEEFEIEVKRNLQAFILDYHARHLENPEQYPLSLPNSNEGLWWEFLQEFSE